MSNAGDTRQMKAPSVLLWSSAQNRILFPAEKQPTAVWVEGGREGQTFFLLTHSRLPPARSGRDGFWWLILVTVVSTYGVQLCS